MLNHQPIPPVPHTVSIEVKDMFNRADTLATFLYAKVTELLIHAVPVERRNQHIPQAKTPSFLSPTMLAEVVRIAFHLSVVYSHPGKSNLSYSFNVSITVKASPSQIRMGCRSPL